MRKGATTWECVLIGYLAIVALRNEKGSYNRLADQSAHHSIVALRNEKGSYNSDAAKPTITHIVALRNEKGSYNLPSDG